MLICHVVVDKCKVEDDKNQSIMFLFRNLEARTDNGELLNLIDGQGCPLNELIYPALALESKTRALFANFKVIMSLKTTFESSGQSLRTTFIDY